jgi:hypothetical protein
MDGDAQPVGRRMSVLIGLITAVVGAFVVTELVWQGIGETSHGAALGFLAFGLTWAACAATSYACAAVTGQRPGWATVVSVVAFPPTFYGLILLSFFAACSGVGPYGCPIN